MWEMLQRDFPGDSVVKNPPANAGDLGSIPALGRAPGEGNGSPLQYFCLGNSTDGGAWQATIHRVTRVGHDLATKPPLRQISLKGVWAFAGSVVKTASCFFSWWQWRGAGAVTAVSASHQIRPVVLSTWRNHTALLTSNLSDPWACFG